MYKRQLQTPRLVRTVLEQHVALLVLVVAQGEQDDVALVDPHLLAELAADVGEALFAVETEGFETAVAEHFEDLGVFWVGGGISWLQMVGATVKWRMGGWWDCVCLCSSTQAASVACTSREHAVETAAQRIVRRLGEILNQTHLDLPP